MEIHLLLLFIIVAISFFGKDNKRVKLVMFLSFLATFIYWAIRYDYGLDYWSYYSRYQSDVESYGSGTGDILFYKLLRIFPYFYQFIVFHSAIVILGLYYLVRKYLSTKYYWFFFLLLYTMSGMTFNMVSALRSTTAAVIIWVAIEFILNEKYGKKTLVLYLSLIVLASFFHTSALFFIALPLLVYAINNVSGRSIFIVLIVADIIGALGVKDIYLFAWGLNSLFEGYNGAYIDSVGNASFFGFLHKSLWLIPAYALTIVKDRVTSYKMKCIFSISFLYFVLFFTGLNFQERFTTYIFIYVIIALVYAFDEIQPSLKKVSIYTILFLSLYSIYLFYQTMLDVTRYDEGNYRVYKTIFDAPSLL